MQRVLTSLAIATLGASLSAAAYAQSVAEDAIKYRRGVLAAHGWNMGIMGQMVKGERPYNQAEFVQRATNLAALSKMALEGFTIPGSESGNTKAKPDLFMEMDNFKAGMQKMETEAAKLVQVAKAGNMNAIKAQHGELAKACKACHDKYREK